MRNAREHAGREKQEEGEQEEASKGKEGRRCEREEDRWDSNTPPQAITPKEFAQQKNSGRRVRNARKERMRRNADARRKQGRKEGMQECWNRSRPRVELSLPYFFSVLPLPTPTPGATTAAIRCAVLAVFFRTLYLANQKRYGPSDSGFELSSCAHAAPARRGEGSRAGERGEGRQQRALREVAHALAAAAGGEQGMLGKAGNGVRR